MKKSRNTKKGFTFIELLVVIAIISFLASIVLAALSDARARARDAARESMVKQVMSALELYSLDNNGNYPVVPLPFDPIDTQLSGLVPKYIPSIHYDDSGNAAVGAHYYRPTSTSDGYIIWFALDRQTGTLNGNPVHTCMIGMGNLINTDGGYFYPGSTVCNK